ncbi:MAG TPA: molybdenum cofactor guanylyltransferase [Syntrophorhabdaceae bacterium]|nr:molybdenum cofactor guanylyltransferase [Syntrophorhabdaceae bacterium]
MKFTCAILAGGASVRMGRDKATLLVKDRPLISYVYDKVKDVFEDIIILSNNSYVLNGIHVPVIKDIVPIQSTLTGIASALIHTQNPYVFVVACDMPNLSREGILYLMENAQGEDIIIPRTEKGYEPLHAIYNRTCIPYMLSLIERREFKISSIFPYVNVKVIDDSPIFQKNHMPVFININITEDLKIMENL